MTKKTMKFGRSSKWKFYFFVFVLLLPALLTVFAFYLTPALLTVTMSFTDMDYRLKWDFIGFGNFQRMMQDRILSRVIVVTGIYVTATLFFFNVGFALVLAIVTTSVSDRVGTFFRSLWLLPRFTPPIVYGIIWMWILDPTKDGFLNNIRNLMGLRPQDWIFNYPIPVIVVINGIIGASFGMLIFTAAIRSISREIIWAARVDGAGWFQTIRYITIPQIRWPLLFVTAYQTLSLLTSYEYILIVTQGGPNYATTVWSLYAYNMCFGGYYAPYRFGYGSALALVLVVLGAVASVVYWRLFKFRQMMAEPLIEVV